MKVAIFSSRHFETDFFTRGNQALVQPHDLTFLEVALSRQTAGLAQGFEVVCCFVTDQIDAPALEILKNVGVRLVALRSAGYNHVDLQAARRLGLPVVRVPAYSPHAVAEHAVALLLSLNRKIHRAYARVRELNFSLEGLMGFDVHGKTVGVIGVGRIGRAFAQIMAGFGCQVIGYDVSPDDTLVQDKVLTYVAPEEIYRRADIISLHVPLVPQTQHLINAAAFAQMKKGVVLINTSRGALVDAHALIDSLKSNHLGGAGLDVYEEEEGVFFHDLSAQVLQDDVLARLLTFPNVLITSHQAFLTHEALTQIAAVTLNNIAQFEARERLLNQV